jgi:hypothetical protein
LDDVFVVFRDIDTDLRIDLLSPQAAGAYGADMGVGAREMGNAGVTGRGK